MKFKLKFKNFLSLPPTLAVVVAASLALMCHAVHSQTTRETATNAAPATVDTAADIPTDLPAVTVKGAAVAAPTPAKTTSTTKGETRALENPQSITVLTRERLDQTQVKSLVEALGSVAGVVAGERGRRGFDDFGIRGAEVGGNQEKFVDGLNTVRSGYIPVEEIFGAERIEILKGGASLLFGVVRPGGLVNIVSRRPKREAFGELGATLGNLGQREFTADIGRPLSSGGRSAFRLTALVNESDDATDFIYFKNRYVAPALTLDLGSATDLTLLASYYDREWVRNQALAAKGTVLPNPNGPVRRSLYIGEPGFGANDAQRLRLGYALEHRFEFGVKLTQNFRWEASEMTQNNTAFYGLLAPDNRTQARTGNVQNDSYRGWAVDTYAAYRIGTALGVHELTAGLDVSDKGGRLVNGNCSLRPIDLYSPVYGAAVTCAAPSDSTQAIFGAGLYLRDQWHVGNGLHLTLGARHDRVTTKTTNNINGSTNAPKDAATTGMVGAVYEVFPGVAPYVSLANSFLPVSGLDRNANVFQPETGRQAEVGVKFERDGGRQTASVAAYDLLRANVLTADPLNAAFNVQQGEQRVKGVEIELLADLRSGWNLTAAYAYTDAVVTKSNVAAQLGRSVNNVPRHSASAFGMYRASSGAMAGWGAGLGVRKVGTRTGYSYDFAVPGYTVFDAAVSFKGNGYRASLNVRNLLDKTYYGGSFSNNLVTLGDTRQLRLNVVREF